MVALDLSGRPFFAHDLQLAGVRIGEFDGDLAAHFFRSLATQAGMTLHVRLLAGSDAHHIVEAVFKGVARALARGLRAPRARRRGAVHQGDALTALRHRGRPPRIAVVDYGMGNLASVAKALERSGADVRVTDEHRRRCATPPPSCCPASAPFATRRRGSSSSGLGAAVLERIAAGAPFLGVCLGLQLLFESSGEGGRWPGLGVFAGTVERLRDRRSRCRTSAGTSSSGRPAGAGMARGLPAPAAVYFVHSYAARPADPAIVAATTDYGGAVVAAVARDNCLGGTVPSREELRRRACVCWPTSWTASSRRYAPHDRLPGRRHPGRQGRAPAARRLRRRHRLRRRPGRPGAALAGRGRRGAARRRPRRGAHRRARQLRHRRAHRRGRSTSPCSTAAASAAPRASRSSPGIGVHWVVMGTAAVTALDLLDDALEVARRAPRRRPGLHRRHGGHARLAAALADERHRASPRSSTSTACKRVVYTDTARDGMLGGPEPHRSARPRRGHARSRSSSRAASRCSTTSAASRSSTCPTSSA